MLKTLAGPVPEPLTEGAVEDDGRLLVPLTMAAAQTLRAQRSAHLDIAAERCLQMVERGGEPPPARLVYVRGMDGEELRLEVLWDPDIGLALRGASRRQRDAVGPAGPLAGRGAGRASSRATR